MRFTPAQNGVTVTARDKALRGNMRGVLEHAANGQSKIGLTRREIIRQVRENRPQVVRAYKTKGFQNRSFAVARVTRKPSIGGFHVVGLGNIPQTTLGELKTRLGSQGFTKFRFGGLPIQRLF